MNSEPINIEGGSIAATCTCGGDLARNGGSIHNYACPMTPKCPHIVSKRDPRTGETIQAPCGSRLEPDFVSHCIGCPELPLCPHCGTSMDRRGFHSISCPNRPNYSENYFHYGIHLPDSIVHLRYENGIPNRQNLQNFNEIFVDVMRNMPAIPPRDPVSPPQIIDGDFDVSGIYCTICRDTCDESQSVMKLSGCNHCFHAGCLTPWIQNHSNCPNCRGDIPLILRKN
jgi:hypothetical protein